MIERLLSLFRPAVPGGPFLVGERRAYYFLLGALSLFVTFFQISFGDFWTHLAQGRYILDHGEIPVTDVFSFTYYGHPWSNWEWLHNTLTAIIWELSGPTGIFLLRFSITWGLCLLFFHIAKNFKVSDPGGFFLASLALVLIQRRISDRPHFISYLFLSVVLLLLSSERVTKAKAILLFLLLLAWRNMHPSWVLGVAVVIAAYLDAWASKCSRERFDLPYAPVWVAAGMAGVFLATPFHIDFSAYFELQGPRSDLLDEWKGFAALSSAQMISPRVFLLLGYLLAVMISVAKNFKRVPWYGALTLGMFYGAYLHLRFIPEAIILGLPLVVRLNRVHFSPTRYRSVVFGLLVFSFSLFIGQKTFADSLLHRGIGLDGRVVPLHAADFMKERGVSGNVYGTYPGTMDFLMFSLYPAVKVAIDVRVPGLYPFSFAEKTLFINTDQELRGNILTLPVDYIVIGYPDFQSLEDHAQGIERVLREEHWSLIYFDQRYAVYAGPGKGTASTPPFSLLSRWNTAPASLSSIVAEGRFNELLHELEMLKKNTAGRDDFYRQTLISLYAQPFFSETEKVALEKLFNVDVSQN